MKVFFTGDSTVCAADLARVEVACPSSASVRRGSRTDLHGRKPNRQYNRIAGGLPGMDDVGSEHDIVASFLKPHLLLRSIDVERDSQDTLDQHRDRGAVAVRPGTGSSVSVGVDAPFDLDVALVPQSEFRGDELADKPSTAAHLICVCIPKIKALAVAHSHFPGRMITAELPRPADIVGRRARRGVKLLGVRTSDDVLLNRTGQGLYNEAQ